MTIKLRHELLLLNILVILLIGIISFFPSNAWRIALGIPLSLFFPGYTLLSLLFPARTALGGIERAALSCGLSVVIVAFIGLILNYTPWGIKVYPVVVSLAVFTVVTSSFAWYRRRSAGPERFTITFDLRLPSLRYESPVNKILSVILGVAVLATIGTFAFITIRPKVGEAFTEFYILGSEGRAEDYPARINTGEEATVSVVICNHEHREITYNVGVTVGGGSTNWMGPIVLAHGGKWQEPAAFKAERAGMGQKVEFLLYQGGSVDSRLSLWVDVY